VEGVCGCGGCCCSFVEVTNPSREALTALAGSLVVSGFVYIADCVNEAGGMRPNLDRDR